MTRCLVLFVVGMALHPQENTYGGALDSHRRRGGLTARYHRMIVPVTEKVSLLGAGPPLLEPVTTTLAV